MLFTLNDLTVTEFENFSFDILKSLDFVNLNWRKGTGRNTIEYFIELMDSLNPQKRDEAFSMVYFDVVWPRFRNPITDDENISHFILDVAQ